MRVLAIEFAADDVRVAEGVRAFGRLRLTRVERAPSRGAPALLARLAAARPDAVSTVLPLGLAAHRFLALPFRQRRRLAATVPFELLGQLPAPPDDAKIAWTPLGAEGSGTALLAAAVRPDDVAAHMAPLAAAGLAPGDVDLAPLPLWNLIEALGGTTALVVADGARSSVSLRREGRLVGLRALSAPAADADAFGAEAAWAANALGETSRCVVAGPDAGSVAAALEARFGSRVERLDLAGALARLGVPGRVRDTDDACATAVGLLVGGGPALRFAAGTASSDGARRRLVVLVLAALALGVLDLGLVRHSLARRDAALVAATRAAAAAALPGSRLVAPREQLEAAMAAATRRQARLGGGVTVLETLREISSRIPASVRLDLDEVAVDRDAVLLHGRTDSFEAVDLARRAIAASPLFADASAEETHTTVDGRRVEFRLRATRGRPGGARS